MPLVAPPSPLARYRAALRQVRAERGERCEVCSAPTNSAHHIVSVGLSGIASALVSEPANLLLLCNACHCLMHPGRRVYPWLTVGRRRSLALGRAS